MSVLVLLLVEGSDFLEMRFAGLGRLDFGEHASNIIFCIIFASINLRSIDRVHLMFFVERFGLKVFSEGRHLSVLSLLLLRVIVVLFGSLTPHDRKVVYFKVEVYVLACFV